MVKMRQQQWSGTVGVHEAILAQVSGKSGPWVPSHKNDNHKMKNLRTWPLELILT